ncbi:bifunctional folylpolyglutamate synthase/dihydrofolate synthase [Salinibacterium sp. dk2585]|uniref:bifunctional folylpolyglutamate synthase/dihydrofolate synthase n=1 Tax=unclassified Salinibacterium TaxID=2632331 RepID=UPI0011C24A70|nr:MULTISPECIES: folylpolyglutamate synthase/dihydrofolate synthase family protein [unclassified Salinibacterium]QEE61450.1 bifunctional folylpolyglutamate synthase/dihydrofolate synthase [Salinibacterium sp. dk2585]TXK54127.1 bifunctional folylpolyglutamate synthase/dihydrofolate synthase [Salinibacterium sp. dk5596]
MSELTNDPELSDDALLQGDADTVYAELLARVGEATPRVRLEPTRRAAALLGDPQAAAPVIHVAGTNGKTSTARMIDSLLRAHGLRTGLLTSPHLSRVNERILIDGEPISNEAFIANWRDIQPYLQMTDAQLEEEGEAPLTFFEAFTLLAFASFADAPVDVVVLETGMGGEWDSTNIADGAVAVLTPIALDHMHRLGSTVQEIARTKAGIIKPGAIVVSAQQDATALAELQAKSREAGAELVLQGEAFDVAASTVAVGGQLVSVRGRAATYSEVFLPLYGTHQAQNAALAVAAVESFLGGGAQAIVSDVIEQGLAESTSPGRLELIGVDPTVIVDAAHNPQGAESIVAAMRDYFDFDEIAVVLGVLEDKDLDGIVARLAPMATRFYVTQSESERAVASDDLAYVVRNLAGADATWEYDVLAEAMDAARRWASEAPKRAVIVTGSITLVGEAMDLARSEGWKA